MRRNAFTLNGESMSALEYLRAARAIYKWPGLIPKSMIPFNEGGDKGSRKNRDAPPGDICRQAEDAWFALSPDDTEAYKKEVRGREPES